eukprot:1391147-Amorphochlora_amoeboformis.AAC.1
MDSYKGLLAVLKRKKAKRKGKATILVDLGLELAFRSCIYICVRLVAWVWSGKLKGGDLLCLFGVSQGKN